MRGTNFILTFLVGACISCGSANDAETAHNGKLPVAEITDSIQKQLPQKQTKLRLEEIQVITARKVRDPHSNYFKEYKAQCKGWKPSKAAITEIFTDSKIIDGREYHYYYEILPCYVIGRVIINCNIKAKYELNAGGSAVIILPDTAYFVGYYGNEHFLTYRADY